LKEEIAVDKFAERIQKQLSMYDRDNLYGMYNPLGSHDTVRIKDELGGDREKIKLAYMFLLAYPGAPALYYGDEIGMEGGKDPDCRRAFPWDENQWDRDLLNFIRSLISLRKNRISLRRGSLQEILVEGERGGYSFGRKLGDESTLFFLNASKTRKNFSLPVGDLGWSDGRIIRDLISQQEYAVSGTDLHINAEAWSAFWLG
jgi:glycosidase